MTDNNDDFDDETPFDKAIEGIKDFDEEIDLDPYLKRAFRQITLGTEELRKAMQKRGLLPIGKH